ncbi:MAG: SRPBCC family protein [Candidatus Dormiibacterota bacterium]
MPRYLTVIDSTWSVAQAFAFMSDFSNAARWDPGVLAAQRLDAGHVKVGSSFDLTVPFAGRKMTLRYAVRSLNAPHQVVFAASTGLLESVDTLTFEALGDACRMTYDADLRFKGIAALANPFLALTFRRIGDRARDSLRSVLTSAQ